MKILGIIILIILVLTIGATIYTYFKMSMFLPALLGLGGFPKIKEKDFYGADGKFRPGTRGDKMGFFMQHPVFKGYKHMYFNVEDNVLKAIAPIKHEFYQKVQGRADQIDSALNAFNYLTKTVEEGKAWLISNIYPENVVKLNPYKGHLTGMFYEGEQGKPLAVIVPGGGFISNVTDCEGYPVAMKLHKMGYSVLVISYPIGKQLGETDRRKQGQQATRELVQVIKYLQEHQKQLHIDLHDYSIFGFSAGGLMTTSYAFSNYDDCCHKHGLPRPKVVFLLYGLDWNIKPSIQDKGLSVFSIVGRQDPYGFADVDDKIPALKKILGEDNVFIRIYENMGHGFGLGENTLVENWVQEAVDFWEVHR
jgi:predicted esterase